MDQSKFMLPSAPGLRASASMAKHVRPSLKLHGCWAYGWVLDLHIMDEPTRHDSSTIVEIVSICLERVHQICQEKHLPMPSTLLLFSDNTVRECKNQFLLSYLNNLVSKRKMRLAGLMCLRKSHSHDQIDQLWGILARRIAACDQLLSPESVRDILRKELQRNALRSWIGLNTEIRVSKLDAAHAWRNHFQPTQRIALQGGLLEDAYANHVFISMSRRGMFLGDRTAISKSVIFK